MNLDTILFHLEKRKGRQPDLDPFTLRDAVQGIQIFGSIGSGKSSGSGRSLALKYLKAGFGGIVLTGKTDERAQWEEYARDANRTSDFVYFDEPSMLEFNPLLYEATRKGSGGGFSENITTLFLSLIKMGNRINGSGSSGGSKDPFWDLAQARLIKALIDFLILTDMEVSVPNFVRIIHSVPHIDNALRFFEQYMKIVKVKGARYFEQTKAIHPIHKEWADDWFMKNLVKAAIQYDDSTLKRAAQKLDHKSKDYLALKGKNQIYNVVKSYFLSDFPSIPEKTKGTILEMFMSFTSAFRSGLLANQFSAGIDDKVRPEETYKKGKVIVIDFPVKDYLQVGIYAQMLYKRAWQQAIERRDVTRYPSPVFMWVDEAQYFLNEDDMMFQTTARSARACSVFLTQNISNYYSVMGGSNAKERVDSLLGNLVTKIFHANNDYVTNEWASKVIAKRYATKVAITRNVSDGGKGTINESKVLENQVNPYDFTVLKTGGSNNDNTVEGYITSLGKEWSTGTNYRKVKFIQRKQES